jgi:hypothetical protein
MHRRSHETYGYLRVHAELHGLGVRYVRWRSQVNAQGRSAGCLCGRKRHATRRDPRAIPVPGLVRRNFVRCHSPGQALDRRRHLCEHR